MNLKSLLVPLSFFAGLSQANAQSATAVSEPEEADDRKARIEFGVRAGGFVSMHQSDGFLTLRNLTGVTGGASVRLRSGLHHRFGLELAANHATSEKTFTQLEYWSGRPVETADYRKNSTEISVQTQLHPGRNDQAIRPYVGGGLGVVWNRLVSSNPTLDNYYGRSFGGPIINAMLQLEQGLTWRVTERFYLSQSLNYRYEMDYATSTVGLRFAAYYGL